MKYEKIKYPDFQISAKITDFEDKVIKERINNYEDLLFVRSLAEVCKNHNVQTELFIPCLFGQRSDRRFDKKQSFDLKIITDIINSCNFRKVEILDPHSDVSLALINNSEKISSFQYVQRAITEIGSKDLVLVSPDAGAYKKVFEYASKLNLPVVAANKFRDLKGEIQLQFLGDVKGKDCLIVDDLCDGGRTFVTLADQLRIQGAEKVCLYISHGYFSNGFDELKKTINHIYCTNSVKDITDSYLTQYKII